MEHITSFLTRIKSTLRKRQDGATSGQAIILIGIAAIGLIAAMGLTIDGGRLLFLRRETQTAADAAALAAARSLCQGTDYEVTAYSAANANGFDNNETDNWVRVSSPPDDYYASNPTGIASLTETERDAVADTLMLASLSTTSRDTSAGTTPIGGTTESMIDMCAGCYVKVEIEAEIPASFVGVVYDGPLSASSSAVGTCSPDINSGAAPALRALWAMGTDCPNASVSVTGSNTEIYGGVHSNGTLQINASNGSCSCNNGTVVGPASYVDDIKNADKIDWYLGDTDTTITTSSGMPCSSSCFNVSGAADDEYPNQNPYQTTVQTEWPVDYNIADYLPDGTIAQAAKAEGKYYEYPCDGNGNSDVMDSQWLTDEGLMDDDHNLADGIYYSECGIHTGQGGQGVDGLTGTVTFISQGDIHIDGANHELSPYVNNLLVFTTASGSGNSSVVHFSGSSNHWDGIIYAPNGNFQTSGSTNGTGEGTENEMNSCIVAQCINFSGSSNIINCEPTDLPEPVPGIWLAQ